MLGLKIVESTMAIKMKNNRQHKLRNWMSNTYHMRIQKKWNKRFGKSMQPCMYTVNPKEIGMSGEKYIVIHPKLLEKIYSIAILNAHVKQDYSNFGSNIYAGAFR